MHYHFRSCRNYLLRKLVGSGSQSWPFKAFVTLSEETCANEREREYESESESENENENENENEKVNMCVREGEKVFKTRFNTV